MRTLLSSAAALLLAGGLACAQAPTGHLDPQAFQAAIAKGDARLIDVRTPEEYGRGHLDGATNIDWNNDDLLTAVKDLDKGTPLLLYCAAGGRSEEAMHALTRAGFTHVHDLKGGIHAWRANGLPVSLK